MEAVSIQVDNTHNKLQTLHEYIDDTEVCIHVLAPSCPALPCIRAKVQNPTVFG